MFAHAGPILAQRAAGIDLGKDGGRRASASSQGRQRCHNGARSVRDGRHCRMAGDTSVIAVTAPSVMSTTLSSITKSKPQASSFCRSCQLLPLNRSGLRVYTKTAGPAIFDASTSGTRPDYTTTRCSFKTQQTARTLNHVSAGCHTYVTPRPVRRFGGIGQQVGANLAGRRIASPSEYRRVPIRLQLRKIPGRLDRFCPT